MVSPRRKKLPNSFFRSSLILTSVFLLLLPRLPTTIAGRCLRSHHDSLLRLKQGFDVSTDHKPVLLSWIPNTDCCMWQGVTCDYSFGEVVGLHLGSLSISGIVEPAALFNLSSLRALDLSFNSLNFSRVSSSPGFDLLPDLNYLNLSASGFEGQIPREIGKLTKLVSLDLSSSHDHPAVKIENPNLETILQNLSNLEELYLDNVNVPKATCPPALYDLVPNLRTFRVPGCSLPRPIDASLSKARVLTETHLETNGRLSSVRPNLSPPHARQISIFLANGNYLSGSIPLSICSLINLEMLDLSDNKLSGQIPHCLAQISSLTYLNLRGNHFEGILPPNFFGPNCGLLTLDLNSNNLHGGLPMTLSNCKGLEFLNLGDNQFTGIFPRMSNHTKLRVLILRSNKLHGTLESLDIRGSTLQILDLSSNDFSGILQTENFINWKTMMFMGGKEDKNTPYLGLSSARQSIVITIKGNDVKIEKIWPEFTALNLAENKFQGRIPELVSNLTSLHLLNLSHNHLFGPIPSSFGQLRQLESLDLSWNRLSGEIPVQLASLTFLSYLNLSYNSLSGKILLEGQFSTFLETSYVGNKNLCGAPILKECQASQAEYKTNAFEPNNSGLWMEDNMIYICFAFGFFYGLAFAVGSLLIWNKGSIWLSVHVNKAFYKAFPSPFFH